MAQKYYLIDSNNRTVAKFEISEESIGYVEGKCFEYVSDDPQFLAEVYCKWDACTLWWFHGKNPEDTVENYRHICGEQAFNNHIRLMCFVWVVVCYIMTKLTKREDQGCSVVVQENYFNTEITRELVELMLEGYLITTDNIDISEVVRLKDLKIGE